LSGARLKIALSLAFVAAGLGCAAVASAAGGGPGEARAELPPGPRLSFLEVRAPKAPSKAGAKFFERAYRLVSVDPRGGDLRRFSTPGVVVAALGTVSWSADGETVAFMAEPTNEVGVEGEQTRLRVYVADADGGHLRPVPGTVGADSPVLSPDGESIAYSVSRIRTPKFDPKDPKSIIPALEHRYAASTAWIAPVAGGRPRRLTGWQNNRWAQPTSFSPDGSRLAVTMVPPFGREEVDTVDLATGKTRTLEPKAGEAAFSPDGARIAFTSYRDGGSVAGFDEPEGTTELYVANADGSGVRRLTRTPEQNETAPSWDPSGSRLGYLRAPGGMLEFLGIEGEVMQSNADGTCPKVVARPATLGRQADTSVQPPAWIPGAERGAGPLSG
jgi:Tol biopolymer transport system component